MSKCQCGYECRLPNEEEMLDRYGCARTIERREQPFNNLIVTMCERETGAPLFDDTQSDGKAFVDAYLQKYSKDSPPKK